MTQTLSDVKLYKDCGDIPILNFNYAVLLDDYASLIKNANQYSEDQLGEIVETKKDELQKVLDSLKNEYQELKFSKDDLVRMKTQGNILYLVGTFQAVEQILSLYGLTFEKRVLESLNKVKGYAFDSKKPIAPQIKAVNRKQDALKNKINIKRLNFERRYGISISEKEEKEIKSKSTVHKQLDAYAHAIEKGLELGYSLDVKKVNAIRWINLTTMLEQRIKQKQ